MHLQVAENVLKSLQNSHNGRLSNLLQQQWPAFYLGSVAPDFQSICHIPRENTHFYGFPPDLSHPAYEVMLEKHQSLADSRCLRPEQAVFVAAYLAHLLLDLIWFEEVVVSLFVHREWAERHQRRLGHFILLTYLDQLALESLPQTAVSTLATAHPNEWLPFAQDSDLVRWRDMLTTQLHPGATIQTVEIYAERLKITPAQFSAHLHDPVWMYQQLFVHVPLEQVQQVLETAVPRSITLINSYLVPYQ